MLIPIIPMFSALLYSYTANAQGSGSMWTSWVPLAVRSPYLSTWMNTTNIPFNSSNVDGILRAPTLWPQFLQGQTNGWAGMIRIDQTTFKWLSDPLPGRDVNRTVLTNMQVTPTRTIMNMTAGPLSLTVTFLSPIEPADPVLQSLPFSYVSLEATSNDGQQHDVQVYLDTSGEWLSGNRSQVMNWAAQTTEEIVYGQFDLESPQPLTEIEHQADDATFFFAMPLVRRMLLYFLGKFVNCLYPDALADIHDRLRPQLSSSISTAWCTNQSNLNGPLPIESSSGFPVFAISVDLGSISVTPAPLVWTVGINRDPAIGYVDGGGTFQQRSPYWVSEFATVQDAMAAFVTGYQDALSRAVALDNKIMTVASSVSVHYSDLVSLAARQAMGGTELTIARSSAASGEWDMSDVKMFMKDVRASGRINPVEGLYASLPFFLYANATYVGWLLEPVLEFGSSGRWPFSYAPKDIGTNYPNATGDSTSHKQGVEQSGNMLIMVLAHARATGDGTLIARYYNLLRTWSEYLVNNTFPLGSSQVSADITDTKANLTNLVLKGIIGIKTMSEISTVMGMESDARRYSNISTSFAAQWQSQAVSPDGQHFVTSLDDSNSPLALTYNIFADKLLTTDIVPSQLCISRTKALSTSISSNGDGLPVDGGLPNQANTVWSMFAAAYTNDTGVQQSIVDQIWRRVSNNATDTGIFATAYELGDTNTYISTTSPFIGGVFAPLSLNVPNVTITIPASTIPSPSRAKTRLRSVGAIVGGAVGGVDGAIVLGILGLVLWRRLRKQRPSAEVNPMVQIAPFSYERTAFGSYSDFAPFSKQQREKSQMTHNMTRPHTAASVPSVSLPSYLTRSAAALDRTQQLSLPAGAVYSQLDVQGLLTEVENLRQLVVQSIGDDESPPEYRSQLASQSVVP